MLIAIFVIISSFNWKSACIFCLYTRKYETSFTTLRVETPGVFYMIPRFHKISLFITSHKTFFFRQPSPVFPLRCHHQLQFVTSLHISSISLPSWVGKVCSCFFGDEKWLVLYNLCANLFTSSHFRLALEWLNRSLLYWNEESVSEVVYAWQQQQPSST